MQVYVCELDVLDIKQLHIYNKKNDGIFQTPIFIEIPRTLSIRFA